MIASQDAPGATKLGLNAYEDTTFGSSMAATPGKSFCRFQHDCIHLTHHSVANLKGSGLAKIDYDFSDSQPWVRTDRNLTFLDETPELNSLYDRDGIDVIAYGPEKAPKQSQPATKPQAQPAPAPIPAPDQPIKQASHQPSPSDQLVNIVVTPSNSAPANSPGNLFGIEDTRYHENAAPEKRRRLTASGYVSYTDSFHGSVSSNSPAQMNQSYVSIQFHPMKPRLAFMLY